MKNNNNTAASKNIRANKNKPSPEIRDILDSRKTEEQEYRGDDITHNRKPHHSKQQKSKK